MTRLPIRYFAVALAVVVTNPSAFAQRITGVVVDSDGKPLEKVAVELYPTGKGDGVERQETKKDGSYVFDSVKFAGAYDIVYTHSKLDMSVVSRLAENKEQVINKVLYKKGEARPALAYHESLLSLERALAIGAVGDALQKDAIFTALKTVRDSQLLLRR